MDFSVIIPNHNGAGTLGEVLAAVFAARYSSLEVIVADDASTDDSSAITAGYPVRLIKHESCQGAAATRNSGAEQARGEILLFIDSDVVIPPETFHILEKHFDDPETSGVIGLLRPVTRFKNLCSQYKNFYMHYTYLKLPRRVTVFYTSIAAIRKKAFAQCGGFDTAYRSATIEDMDFGVRLTGRGFRILIDKSLQVDHIRRYTPPGLLKTGFRRAAGLARIALRDRLSRKEKSSYVTANPAFLARIALSFLTVLFLILLIVFGNPRWLLPAGACWLAIVVLNSDFLTGLARATRPFFFVAGSGLIFLDLLAYGCGVLWGVVSFLRGERY
ncbi:MAG: glycosyltransferase [PVC group bacterium]